MHLLVRFPLLLSLCLMVPHVHGVFLLCFVTITIPIPSNTKCKVSDLQKSESESYHVSTANYGNGVTL